jgi:hypothetical protein
MIWFNPINHDLRRTRADPAADPPTSRGTLDAAEHFCSKVGLAGLPEGNSLDGKPKKTKPQQNTREKKP